jgi:hypothetical protein
MRRRRLRGSHQGAVCLPTAWQEVFDTATDLGIDLPDTATPRGQPTTTGPVRRGAERGRSTG